MTEKHTNPKWTGIIGTISAKYFSSPLRRLSEYLFFGNIESPFLNKVYNLIHGNEVILDVGAGSGYFSLKIAEKLKNGKVICLDLSEEMLYQLEKRANKKGLTDKIQIIKGDASSIKLEDKCVDLVVSNAVIKEFANPEYVLREMSRVLKPGGWIIITEWRKTRIIGTLLSGIFKDTHGPFNVNELETIFTKVGLTNVTVSSVKHWVMGIGKKRSKKAGGQPLTILK